MWFVAIPTLLSVHSLVHHTFMNAFVPMYQAFDTYTKHCWTGRATSLAVQVVVLPLAAIFGAHDVSMHVLGMYILTDMAHLIQYDHDPMTWVHHIGTFIAYLATFYVDAPTLQSMMVGTMILEWTSPWIHLCWFANKAGLASRPWFYYLSGFTVINYALVRCMFFPYYMLAYAPEVMWPAGIFFTLLNWMWLIQLVGYAKALNTKAK